MRIKLEENVLYFDDQPVGYKATFSERNERRRDEMSGQWLGCNVRRFSFRAVLGSPDGSRPNLHHEALAQLNDAHRSTVPGPSSDLPEPLRHTLDGPSFADVNWPVVIESMESDWSSRKSNKTDVRFTVFEENPNIVKLTAAQPGDRLK